MGTRRLIKMLAAACCAATLAAGCSASGSAAVGEQPPPPTVALGSTAAPASPAPSTSAPNCDPTKASAAPNPDAVNGADVAAIRNRPSHVIKIGVAADQYLTGYLGPDGTEEGFDIDLGHAIAKSLFGDPNDVQFVVLSTADRIPALRNHQVDLVIDTFTITCERLTQIDFSAVYYQASQRLLVTQGSSVQSLADLGKNTQVCAQTGSTSVGLIQAAHLTAYQVTNITDCLVALQQNVVSAISTDDTLLAGLQAQDPNLKVVGPALEPEPYGIGIPPKETDMEEYVNGVLAGYESGGEWADSYRQWFLHSLGAATPPVAQYSG